MSLEDFFNSIWGQNKGMVYLPLRSPQNGWTKVYFKWPDHRWKVLEHVVRQTELKNEVYFAPALFRDNVVTDRATPNKYAVLGTQVLWADFDGSGGTPPPKDWNALASLGIGEPSLIVQTSGATNQHTYWTLDEFQTDVEWIENKNRALAYTVDSDKGVFDAARLLRPPDSINYGYSKPQRKGQHFPVKTLPASGKLHSIESFSHLKNIRLLVEESLIITDTPSVDDIKMDCDWSERMKSLFRASLTPKVDHTSEALVSLAMQAAELSWKDAQIYALILDADTRWGTYTDRKDRTRLLTNIVERARRKHPTGLSDLTFAGLLGTNVETKVDPQTSYTYGEFSELDTTIEWRLENLLSTRGYGIIFGESGLGKTQLGIQLGKSLACGQDFFQWKNVSGPCSVYFFSLELSAAEVKYFTSRQDTDHTEKELALLGQNFRIGPIGQALGVDSEEGKKYFEGELDKYRPDVVFIDSLGTLTMGEIEKSGPARDLLKYIQAIRIKYGCAIYLVHHSNKGDASNEPRLRDGYGNTYLFTPTDFVLALWKPEKAGPNIVKLSSLKVRFGPTPEPMLLYRKPSLLFIDWEESDGAIRLSPGPRAGGKSIADMLKYAGQGGEL